MRNEDNTREPLIEEFDPLRSVVEEISDIFFIKNLEGRYLFMNQAGLDFGGWSSQQVIGHDDNAIFPKEMVEKLRAADKKTISDGITTTFEELVQTPTGPVTVITTKGVYRNKNSDIVGLFGIVKDISERKKTEEELSTITEQLTTILGTLPVCPYAAKANGDFGAVYVSPDVTKITAYQPEDFTSDPEFWASHIHPDDSDRVLKAFDKIFEVRQLEIEYRWEVSEGKYRWFSDVCRVVLKDDGSVDHMAGIWHDITPRKELEEQLLQSQKLEAIGTLAGGIAHDFNNILGVILGTTEMGMMDLPKEGKERKHFERIYQSGKRAANLVRQIMTFSRMDATSFKPLNLSLVVHEALLMVRATLPASIQLQQNLLECCPTIDADETQIHQIIHNLCSNAHHAIGEEGGILEITLEEERDCPASMSVDEGTCLKLTVKDSGHGIKLDDQALIFDPFFTTKEVGIGTGLGLAVIHGIMKEHQGMVTVESQSGQGATFSLFFPTIETGIQKSHVQDLAPKKGKGHILVVEDEPELLNLYREFLGDRDYVTTVCGDGFEALEKFKENSNQIDLVLTDHAMPNMTGKQLISKLLDIRPDIPIIFSTGYSDLVSEEEIQALGIRKYLMKPLELTLLQETIEECLSSS